MALRTTHTFAILELSSQAYEEIKKKLLEAGYSHAIMEDGGREVIDMHGIGVQMEKIDEDKEAES